MRDILKSILVSAVILGGVQAAWAKSTDTSVTTKKKAPKRKKTKTAKKKKDAPACDTRKTVKDTTKLPAAAVVQLRYIEKKDSYGAYASGSLISPHTVLTCGHCVWNRKKGSYNQRPMAILPGAFKVSNRQLELPFGSYRLDDVNGHKRTNKKFKTASKATRGSYDYGAMYVVCPFDHLKTYVPLAFKSSKKTVRLSGYPIEQLPSSIQGGDQITGTGKVSEHIGRVMHYDVRSTGGASGGPVFEYDAQSDTHRQIAINTHHTTQCNGGGVELLGRNEDLILKWMKWKPTAKEMKAKGCRKLAAGVSWKDLQAKYGKKGNPLKSAKKLGVVEKKLIQSLTASSEVYQYIEGTLYHWKEYGQFGGKRAIKMLSPKEKWLSVKEARVLLTASSKWKKSDLISARSKSKRVDVGSAKAIEMPKRPKPAVIKNESDDTE